MMGSAWDKQLWQDKMQQLPLEGDEPSMWQNMHALLDENMPVNTPGSGPSAPKNLPGASTIISAIVILSAVAVLLFHWLNSPNPGKQKHGNQINKVQVDSLQNSVDSSGSAAANQKTAADKESAANNTYAVTAADGNAQKGADNTQKEQPATDKNNAANKPGEISNSSVNGNAANGNAANSTSNKKLPGGHVAGKNTGMAQSNTNGAKPLTGGGKNHLLNHTVVSGAQSSGNAGLQHAGQSGKGGHNFGKQGKNMAYLQKPGKSNYGNVVNSPAKPGQQGGNIKADTTSFQQKTGNDTIASLIKTNQQLAQNGLVLTAQKDSSGTSATSPGTGNNKQAAQNKNTAKGKAARDAKLKNNTTKTKKQPGSGTSKFEFDIRMGYNTGAGASAYPAISAGYFFTPKVGVMIGADVLASRTLSGSYNSNTQFTYRVDTGKFGTRQSGQIIIGGSRKLYTIDVPITINYHINKYVSVYGGPVMSIPIKANAANSSVIKIARDNDTTRNLAAPYVNATIINSKFDYGFTGGVRLHFNRFFISGSYMQDMQSYTISSGLGSGKISRYHTVQFGIGYQLFKPKVK